MNQLAVSERHGETCETNQHRLTEGCKLDSCGSGSLGPCSLKMSSTMDTTYATDSFATPKRQSNSQFRQMISQQVGQLLFNSPLSVCCCQLHKDTSAEENDFTKRVNKKHRCHHFMREKKRKHCRTLDSQHEHVTGKCQSETYETHSSEYSCALSQQHIYEDITDSVDERSLLDEGFLVDSILSTVLPHNETICKNLRERTPCDGRESSPVQQRRKRTSTLESKCTVRIMNRSMSMKENEQKDKNNDI